MRFKILLPREQYRTRPEQTKQVNQQFFLDSFVFDRVPCTFNASTMSALTSLYANQRKLRDGPSLAPETFVDHQPFAVPFETAIPLPIPYFILRHVSPTLQHTIRRWLHVTTAAAFCPASFPVPTFLIFCFSAHCLEATLPRSAASARAFFAASSVKISASALLYQEDTHHVLQDIVLKAQNCVCSRDMTCE